VSNVIAPAQAVDTVSSLPSDFSTSATWLFPHGETLGKSTVA